MYSANTIFLSLFALVYLLHYSPWLTLVALGSHAHRQQSWCSIFGSLIHTGFERISQLFPTSRRRRRRTTPGAADSRFRREKSEIGRFERLNREYIARALRLVQLMGMLWPRSSSSSYFDGDTLLAGGKLVIQHRIFGRAILSASTHTCCSYLAIIAVGWVVNIFQRGTARLRESTS